MQNRAGPQLIPFTALVGLEEVKLALLLNVVDPKLGGCLVEGPKGTGKSSVVRALEDILPEIVVIKDCPFNCSPNQPCEVCHKKTAAGHDLITEKKKMEIVNLPLGATEDRVVGSLDIEKALSEGVQALEPGLLARANQNILCIDEINLLPDHLVDDLLDAAASGWNVVEREGISVAHPSRFVLIGSMNPEEGELRPQLLDRLSLHVSVRNSFSVEERKRIIELNLKKEDFHEDFLKEWEPTQKELKKQLEIARKRLSSIPISSRVQLIVAFLCSELQVDGYRPDIIISRAVRAKVALEGRNEAEDQDILACALLTLTHRTREGGMSPPPSEKEIRNAFSVALKASKEKK